MASNILSRLLPSAGDDGPSQPRRRSSLESDPEDTAAMAIDEENLGERFQDQDLEALLAEAAGSDIGTESVAYPPSKSTPRRSTGKTETKSKGKRNWLRQSPKTGAAVMDDDDDDVPASLMLEGRKRASAGRDPPRGRMPAAAIDEPPPPVPGPATRHARQQWEATRTQQRLHDHGAAGNAPSIPRNPVRNIGRGIFHPDPKARAMWKWANVENLDNFLTQVYDYYMMKGIWSIALKRVLSLL
jgi:autophagy-related protein 9